METGGEEGPVIRVVVSSKAVINKETNKEYVRKTSVLVLLFSELILR